MGRVARFAAFLNRGYFIARSCGVSINRLRGISLFGGRVSSCEDTRGDGSKRE